MADKANTTAVEILARLLEGNRRFAQGRPAQADRSPECRRALAQGQTPVALIVTCADSRVSPEYVFDQGLGELFVVRTAGALLDAIGAESVRFGFAALKIKLAIAMGHSGCGAARAALESAPGATADLPAIAAAYAPLVSRLASTNKAAHAQKLESFDPVLELVNLSALKTAERLEELAPKPDSTLIVAARYDLETGLVTLLKPTLGELGLA